jgi:hypothetical protein
MNRKTIAIAIALTGSFACAQGGQAIKKGPWTKRDVPDGWVMHETRNYQVQSQAGIEKARRLGDHMEAMNLVYRAMFRPDKEGAKRYPIKLLKDRKAFLGYGAPAGAGAYYSATDHEMVCYDTGKWMDEQEAPVTAVDSEEERRDFRKFLQRYEMDILGAAAHEGWHQYFHWYVTSWVQLPSWINEGMGDYFYTAVPKKEKGKRLPAELGRTNDIRLAVMLAAVRQDRQVALNDFVRYSQREYYANPGVCYAQGWALCQFLLHGGNDKYAKVIPVFVRTVRDDTNMEEVTKKAFKGIDMAELEKDFLAWVKEQQPEPAAK